MKFKQLLNNCLNYNQLLFNTVFKRCLFKQSCLLCKSADGGDIAICNDCVKDLPWHIQPHCPQCGLLSFNSQLCGHCLKSAPDFDATHALFTYVYPLDALLQRYKYGSMLNFSHSFADLMSEDLLLSNTKAKDIDLIIPMPMHPQRLQERGFNQALEIAKLVSNKLEVPLDYKSCLRNKLTPPQASLPLKERVKSIHGVFSIKKSHAHNLQGLKIALIDDVMTSGASLNELAKTIKKAGASHVECWVIARTLPK